MKPILAIALMAMLAGCATAPVGSVVGGECKLTNTPTYAVMGKTSYDQEWIDDTTEALVRGCKRPRPKARPASLDAPKGAPAAVKPKPKHWWSR